MLNTKTIRAGKCLDHTTRLLDYAVECKKAGKECEYTLAQGVVTLEDGSRILHCWLETGDTVIDLTQKTPVINKDRYYNQSGGVEQVWVYTADQMVDKFIATGRWAFWDRSKQEITAMTTGRAKRVKVGA